MIIVETVTSELLVQTCLESKRPGGFCPARRFSTVQKVKAGLGWSLARMETWSRRALEC